MAGDALNAYQYAMQAKQYAQQQSLLTMSMGVFGQSPFGGLLGSGGSAPTPTPIGPKINDLLLLVEEEMP